MKFTFTSASRLLHPTADVGGLPSIITCQRNQNETNAAQPSRNSFFLRSTAKNRRTIRLSLFNTDFLSSHICNQNRPHFYRPLPGVVTQQTMWCVGGGREHLTQRNRRVARAAGSLIQEAFSPLTASCWSLVDHLMDSLSTKCNSRYSFLNLDQDLLELEKSLRLAFKRSIIAQE